MKIKSTILAIMIPVVILGGMALTNALDLADSETDRVPVKFETGDAAGEYNPEDIRGSYTFDDVSTLFEVPAEELRTAFGLPQDVDLTVFRTGDLESVYADQLAEDQEMGNSSVQLFVALYKGLPYPLIEDNYLPTAAVDLLKANATLAPEALAYLETHTLPLTPLESAAAVEVVQAAAEEEHTEVDGAVETINGKTTFKQMLDAGVTEEQIAEILGTEMPNPILTIKDYCLENGLEFFNSQGRSGSQDRRRINISINQEAVPLSFGTASFFVYCGSALTSIAFISMYFRATGMMQADGLWYSKPSPHKIRINTSFDLRNIMRFSSCMQ